MDDAASAAISEVAVGLLKKGEIQALVSTTHHEPRSLLGYHEYQQGKGAPLCVVRVLEPGLTFRVSDYGTRRRFSRAWHDEVIATFKREIPDRFAGTSNV